MRRLVMAWLLFSSAVAGCNAAAPITVPTAQPWGKPLVETTCDDWLDVMDRMQRSDMAARLLDVIGGDRPVVAAEVAAYELAITGYCRSPREDLRAGLGDIVDRISSAAAFTYERVTGEPVPSP